MGLSDPDDAGVIQLDDHTALVQTVDFFTPVVDDPYAFGQIAAANSLSDIYAMGAHPLTALNLVGFSISRLNASLLADILRGASDKVKEADAIIIGGHSIDDPEPKFGLAVTGKAHPDKLWRKGGGRPGDRLILTKPIGIGIYTTGIKRDQVTKEEIHRVTQVMSTLNKAAAESLSEMDVHACTDVTGFGLLGHAFEMCLGKPIGLEIDAHAVPILPRTEELVAQGIVPGGTQANIRYLKDHLIIKDGVSSFMQTILCDAVTSGGLLFAIPKEQAEKALDLLHQNQVNDARIIGQVTERHPGTIQVNV
ncbi:selenophosphate synthase [Melghirimyces algeriensis]|uniref:Selenophosphate synthase n=1 Tax=Melghirimyces algeriensis TaxID=910412 RepID=A0A521BSR9_9BACL|nr:selenophosphate synthase [Melghirimyces algeriensis]